MPGLHRALRGRLAIASALLLLLIPSLVEAQPSWFRRGDAGGDGRVDLDDAVRINDYLFLGGPPFDCFDAADADDDDSITTSDGLLILNWSLAGGPPPPDPGPVRCGPDPTAGVLDCISYSCAFIRGDANGNGVVDMVDAVAVNDFLFLGVALPCHDAADADDDGSITISDATLILGGAALGLPGPLACGPDYTEDTLDCQMYANPPLFLRGDADGDGDVDIDDATAVADFLFAGGFLGCEAAGDANGDMALNNNDTIYILNFVAGGAAPPAPFPICGIDATTPLSCEEKQCVFIRGDADGDNQVDEDDAIAILDFLNLGTPLPCLDAADSNDDGGINLPDALLILNAVSGLGPPPPAPGPHVCGIDPTVDALNCESYDCLIPNDFRRGDCNTDGLFDISDAIFFLSVIFPPAAGAPVATCRDACDANDDGMLNIADAIRILCGIFACGPLPAAPHPDCGYDPTPVDMLGCEDYTDLGCP